MRSKAAAQLLYVFMRSKTAACCSLVQSVYSCNYVSDEQMRMQCRHQLSIQLTTNLTTYMQQLVLEAWFEHVAMLGLMLNVCSHVFGQVHDL